MDSHLYLTNKQFLELLKLQRRRLNKIDKVHCEDSTQIGNKHTKSNVGMCDDSLCVKKEYALFPKEFPQRKSLKYTQDNQVCPLEHRIKESEGCWSGCFYHCLLFQHNLQNIGKVKELYDKKITKMAGG